MGSAGGGGAGLAESRVRGHGGLVVVVVVVVAEEVVVEMDEVPATRVAGEGDVWGGR